MANRIEYTSPHGEVLEASLNKTELFRGRWDTGKYVVKLVLTGDALEKVKADVEEFITDSVGPKKAKYFIRPFKQTKDGEKTFIVFKAAAKVIVKGEEQDRKVAVFDTKGNPVKRELNIGSGSIVKLKGSMTLNEEHKCVSFWMDAIQVIKLVEYMSPAALSGVEDEFEAVFDAVDDEDGFVA